MLSAPALRRTALILHGNALLTSAASFHLLYILSVLERLRKVANVAADLFVTVDRQGNNGNKAKGKPRVRLDDLATVVAAVVTLAGDTLVALDFLAKGMFATGEDKTHGGCFVRGLS